MHAAVDFIKTLYTTVNTCGPELMFSFPKDLTYIRLQSAATSLSTHITLE